MGGRVKAGESERDERGSLLAGSQRSVRPVAQQPKGALPAPRAGAHRLTAVGGIAALQREAGNRVVTRILQAKLTVGAAHDPYEQEADRAADQVMAQLRGGGHVDGGDVEIATEDTELAPPVATLSRVSRQTAPAGVVGSEGGDLDACTDHAIATAGGGRGLDAPLRRSMEGAFGADFSGVRIHADSGAHTLNEHVGAAAFTTGNKIFFRRGTYDPGSTAGQRLIAHELAHVVQQGAAKSAPDISRRLLGLTRSTSGRPGIQRLYAGLDAVGKARIDQQAEEEYAAKAAEFELKMAPTIMGAPAANVIVDTLLDRVQAIVDAWAVSTGREKRAAYEREFGWAGGDQFYGAFLMTGENIKKVFEDHSQPLRTKLKVVYNAVRNNNLQKWLKLAAIELDRKAKGKAPRDWQIRTGTTAVTTKDSSGKASVVSGRTEKEVVKSGFAAQSGLEALMSGPQVASWSKLAESEKLSDEWFGTKRDTFGHDRFSSGMNFDPANAKANKERTPEASHGLALTDQRTLAVGDVPDLTDPEIEQHYRNTKKPAPDAAEKLKFKSAPGEKLSWSQGGEYFDINLGSESAKLAAECKARMEAGISGSTDLMLHAAQWLGMSGGELLELRLALAGWMMANRDHSFYEIYRAAEAYGLPFSIDKNDPGQEYEDAHNLLPMQPSDFAGLLAGNVFPKHFLSLAYKDNLSTTLGPAKTADDLKVALRDQGVDDADLTTLDDRGLAELSRLATLVKAAALPANDDAAKLDQAIRRLRQTPAYTYLGNVLGAAKALPLLNALIRKHHFGKGRGASPDLAVALADAGIPASIVAKATGSLLADLNSLRVAVMSGAPFPGPALSRLASVFSAKELADVKRVLVQSYRGNAGLAAAPDQERADMVRRWAQFERIAQMKKTSGWWYSWNSDSYSRNVSTKPIKPFTATVPSTQGPGLYVAKNLWSSASYGVEPGNRAVAVLLNNAPTIDKGDAAQKAELNKVKPVPGNQNSTDILEKVGLYKEVTEVNLLLVYGGYARLNTDLGVTEKTLNLARIPLANLTSDYNRIGEPGAKQNLKDQAAESTPTIVLP